jgi:G:T-mismatch repair DNA endonuclease (very short patch repair protein)
MGWEALVVWECELSNAETIEQMGETVRRFLAEVSAGQ